MARGGSFEALQCTQTQERTMWLAAEAGQGESHDTCVPETQARQVSASDSQLVLVWHLSGI